jgi:hypothetical protein
MSFQFKTRTISFRLTAEEYDRFHQFCFEQNIASVSEVARAAPSSLLDHRPTNERITPLGAA